MSGVAKDETTPNSVNDEAVADNAEVEAVAEAPEAEHVFPPLFPPKDSEVEAPARSRRVAPHLRVVTENDAPAEIAEPAMRVGPMMRAERERQGLSLEQVSRETRVTVSHLKAIEDMTPNLIGEAVYVKGHIRTYARHLKLDPDDTVTRYLRESAILADPEKQDIAPPATARKLPMALPVLGMVIVALLAGGAVYFVVRGTGASAPTTQTAQAPAATTAVTPDAEPTGPAITSASGPVLRLVAIKRARIEVRGADGTPYRKRFFSPGESYSPRVGAGWTVTTNDGSAFEWRLGDASLGLLAPEGPVYAQAVDLALSREPLIDPNAPVDTSASDLEANVPAPTGAAVAAPPKPKPKPVAPKPAATPAQAAAAPTPSADEANQAAPVDPFAAN